MSQFHLSGFVSVCRKHQRVQGPLAPKIFFKIVFSGNFKGKPLFSATFGLSPPSGQNSTGPPLTKILDPSLGSPLSKSGSLVFLRLCFRSQPAESAAAAAAAVWGQVQGLRVPGVRAEQQGQGPLLQVLSVILKALSLGFSTSFLLDKKTSAELSSQKPEAALLTSTLTTHLTPYASLSTPR